MIYTESITVSDDAIKFLLEVKGFCVISQNNPVHNHLFTTNFHKARIECISQNLIQRVDKSKYEPIQFALSDRGLSVLYQYKNEKQ